MSIIYYVEEEVNLLYLAIHPSPEGEGFLARQVKYTIGEIIAEPNAIKSDKQCGVGLHVFRPGIRPEFVGLCDPDHLFICLEVEVNREDICFGGLPGNCDKLRVKKLKVLRKL
jgi:hypothetical protein